MAEFFKILIITLLIPLFSSGEDKSVYFYESYEKVELEETAVFSFDNIIEKNTSCSGGKNSIVEQIFLQKEILIPFLETESNAALISRGTFSSSKTHLFILYCSLKLHF